MVDATTRIGNDTMAVAASGSSLAIAWPDASVTPNDLYVKLFDGAWHAPANMEGEGESVYNPAITGDGAGGFCLAWQESGYWFTTVYTRQYVPGSGWEIVPVDMSYPRLYGTGLYAVEPRVASNGTGYAVIFNQQDEYGAGSLYANVYDEGLWLGAEALDNLNSDIINVDDYAIASNGQGYGAVWMQNDTRHGTMLYGSSYRRDKWHNVALSNGRGDVTYCDITAGVSMYTPFWFQTDEEDVLVENVWTNKMQ